MDIPTEILTRILQIIIFNKYLDYTDFLNIVQVCKNWNKIAKRLTRNVSKLTIEEDLAVFETIEEESIFNIELINLSSYKKLKHIIAELSIITLEVTDFQFVDLDNLGRCMKFQNLQQITLPDLVEDIYKRHKFEQQLINNNADGILQIKNISTIEVLNNQTLKKRFKSISLFTPAICRNNNNSLTTNFTIKLSEKPTNITSLKAFAAQEHNVYPIFSHNSLLTLSSKIREISIFWGTDKQVTVFTPQLQLLAEKFSRAKTNYYINVKAKNNTTTTKIANEMMSELCDSIKYYIKPTTTILTISIIANLNQKEVNAQISTDCNLHIQQEKTVKNFNILLKHTFK